MMLHYVLPVVIGALALALALAAWRLWRGPSAADRVLALDTLYINALALLVALGVVLAIKMGIEETQMAARHPGYTGYVRSTKRIVPFIW